MIEDVADEELEEKLIGLETEHRDLDQAIVAMISGGRGSAIQVQRLKKRKLMLKDEISVLRTRLIPDMIA